MSINAKYQWSTAPKTTDVKSLLRVLYQARDISTNAGVKAFLHPEITTIHSPWELHDMKPAVERIKLAIENHEQITVYGDYDADGITSTSLLSEVLVRLGANVNYYVPDRFRDGYGPNQKAYDWLIQNGTQLVITVDNGVSGKKVIDHAVDCGIDVVITDHHQIPAELPTKACAIVHPGFPKTKYPFAGLSGVGVAFKVAWALLGEMPIDELDLVAIGEIADVVPVSDENRLLISMGLKQIEQTKRPGLRELLELAHLTGRKLSSTEVGFDIAPRLNSLGRIGNPSQGVAMLTSFDSRQAENIACSAENLNQKRKKLVQDIYQEAVKQAENNQANALIVAGKTWHQGVLGIVASRILEETGKPTVVISGNGLMKGSGRSREGFDLYRALDPHRDLLVAFGGHPQACGLSVESREVAPLQEAFAYEAGQQGFSANMKPKLVVDAEVDPRVVSSVKSYEILHKLQPYGPGNRQPELVIKNVLPTNFFEMGTEGQHLKFMVDGLTCVDFNVPGLKEQINGQRVDIVGKLNLNIWRNTKTVQLLVDDIRTV